jgi:hypothetical protein
MLKNQTNLLLAILIGIVGGAFCGAMILPISLWRTTRELEFSVLGWGSLYGATIGAFSVSVAYLFVLRKTGLKRAFVPSLAGTLVGGFLGAIVAPFWAMVSGVLGFSFAVIWIASRKSEVLR